MIIGLLFPRYRYFSEESKNYQTSNSKNSRGEWPSSLYSLRQVTEVKLGRVRSDFGWVTTEA